MADIFDAFTDETEEAPRRRRRREENGDKEKRRRTRRIRTTAVIVVLVALLAGVLVTLAPQVQRWFGSDSPISKILGNDGPDDYSGDEQGEEVEVTIPEGSSGAQMGSILESSDVVASAAAFTDAFRNDPNSGTIQPGTYRLPTKISGSQALELLKDRDGSRIDLTITIPEGFTKKQVHERVASVMDIPLEDVEAAAADSEAIGLPEEADGNVEGWYKPGTSSFAPGTSATDVLASFVSARVSELDSLGLEADEREEVLIKASIVEREVNLPQYYSQVAQVIDNRLEDSDLVNGRLQMDSTVLYGVGKSGGIPTSEDLKDDNPYNTYLHPGLPPAPIGAAGELAIQGVMRPAEGDWLYFVTVNLDTGETLFTDSLEEQKANTEKLTEWLDAHPGKEEE